MNIQPATPFGEPCEKAGPHRKEGVAKAGVPKPPGKRGHPRDERYIYIMWMVVFNGKVYDKCRTFMMSRWKKLGCKIPGIFQEKSKIPFEKMPQNKDMPQPVSRGYLGMLFIPGKLIAFWCSVCGVF